MGIKRQKLHTKVPGSSTENTFNLFSNISDISGEYAHYFICYTDDDQLAYCPMSIKLLSGKGVNKKIGNFTYHTVNLEPTIYLEFEDSIESTQVGAIYHKKLISVSSNMKFNHDVRIYLGTTSTNLSVVYTYPKGTLSADVNYSIGNKTNTTFYYKLDIPAFYKTVSTKGFFISNRDDTETLLYTCETDLALSKGLTFYTKLGSAMDWKQFPESYEAGITTKTFSNSNIISFTNAQVITSFYRYFKIVYNGITVYSNKRGINAGSDIPGEWPPSPSQRGSWHYFDFSFQDEITGSTELKSVTKLDWNTSETYKTSVTIPIYNPEC